MPACSECGTSTKISSCHCELVQRGKGVQRIEGLRKFRVMLSYSLYNAKPEVETTRQIFFTHETEKKEIRYRQNY